MRCPVTDFRDYTVSNLTFLVKATDGSEAGVEMLSVHRNGRTLIAASVSHSICHEIPFCS